MKTKQEMDHFLAKSKKDFDNAIQTFDKTMVSCKKLIKKIDRLDKKRNTK
jgi:hypothetical protein